MSAFVYGTPDISCAVGIAEPSDGEEPLPFIAFFRLSSVPEAELCGLQEGSEAMSMIKTVQKHGGFVIYFDNPESAERLHSLMKIVFTLASRCDWSDREEMRGAVN